MNAVANEIQKLEDAHQRAERRKSGIRSVPPAVVSKVFTAPELMALELPEAKEIIPGVLYEGTNLVVASPKMGKTYLALGYAIAIASGGRALGKIPVGPQGDVLGVFKEDGIRRLRNRLRTMLDGQPVPERLTMAVEWPTIDEGGIDKARAWAKQAKDPQLMIFDTLKGIRPREYGNSRLYDLDYNACAPLTDLAHELGIAILIIHHTRKMQSADHVDMASGSLGLAASVDVVQTLKRERGRADATLCISGRDCEDKELALQWDSKLTQWNLLGDAADYRRSNERQEVIALFRAQCKSLAPKAVSDLLGRTPSAVMKLLWTMNRDGDLHADGNGRYSLPNENYSEPTKEELRRAALDPDEWRRLEGEAERQEGVC
jgi:hypothetical protein